MLLTDRQISRLRKAFANISSANIKLSKAQLPKTVQSEGLLGRFVGPLLKTSLPLIKNVLKVLDKSVLIPLGLIAAASTTDPGMHKKIFGSLMKTLIVSNEEMEDIMKIWLIEESGLLIKDVSKTIENEAKEQKGRFLGMLLCTLGVSLLGNLLTGKRVKAKIPGKGAIRAGKERLDQARKQT